jgi:hypothetical protein
MRIWLAPPTIRHDAYLHDASGIDVRCRSHYCRSRAAAAERCGILWLQKLTFERLEHRRWPPWDLCAQAIETSMREITAQIRDERATAQDGPPFDRLKKAHPRRPCGCEAGDHDRAEVRRRLQ